MSVVESQEEFRGKIEANVDAICIRLDMVCERLEKINDKFEVLTLDVTRIKTAFSIIGGTIVIISTTLLGTLFGWIRK